MPKITEISVTAVRVPLETVTYLANRTVRHRDYGLVRVISSEGLAGLGFCYVGNNGGEIFPVAVEHLLAPILLGRDSHEVEGLWKAMVQESLLQGRAGTVMRAISALDAALWDLNARSAALPLHRFLGAVQLDSVPAYASGGYYVDGQTPDDIAAEMAGYVARGFRAVKMRTGRFSPAQEADRLAAVRERIGPDIELMLDANNAWTDVTEALRTLRRLERFDPYWIEEPFSPDDIDSHARLARATAIPVATGEVEVGRWRFKEMLDKGAAAIIQADALVCGGISEWRRIAALAAGYGVPVCPHWFHDLHAPLVAATPNARYAEFFPDNAVLNFLGLVDRPMECRDGRIQLRQGPGLGFDFDAAKVAACVLGRRGAAAWITLRT